MIRDLGAQLANAEPHHQRFCHAERSSEESAATLTAQSKHPYPRAGVLSVTEIVPRGQDGPTMQNEEAASVQTQHTYA